MIAIAFVILFPLIMAAFWAKEGLFSSFLHCVLVILAGSLAIAFWEPLAFMLLGSGSMATHFAWGVALLVPFGLFLFLMRLAMDKLVPGNLVFPQIVDLAGGAGFGLISGVLTAGLIIIGVSFLPGASYFGYKPYAVAADSKVEHVSSLLLPADTITSGFFETISAGAFHPFFGDSLATASPDLAAQAGQFGLAHDYDEFASLVAAPDTVSVVTAAQAPTPAEKAGIAKVVIDALPANLQAQLEGGKDHLVAVQLNFSANSAGTFDTDRTLRLPPAQVRLLPKAGGELGVLPIAFATQNDSDSNKLDFRPIINNNVIVYATPSTSKVTCLFLVPAEFEPGAVRVRNLRVPITGDITEGGEAVAALLGEPKSAENVLKDGESKTGEGEVGEATGPATGTQATGIEQTAQLPHMFSKNAGTGFSYTDSEPAAITDGAGVVKTSHGNVVAGNRVELIYGPSHMAMIRLEIEQRHMQSLLGAARAAAAGLGGVWLEDNRGQGVDSQYFPIAFALDQGGAMDIAIASGGTFFRSARELPVDRMNASDKLYLYFQVPYGVTLTSYNIGEMKQTLDFHVVKRD